KVTGIAAIAYDVTAIVASRRSAEAANATKDEFLAMLGHELRNPLAPIATALELMRGRPDVGAERERAVIERQVRHLVRLVDDLLDVSRIARGKVELRREALSLAEIVAQAAETASPLFDQRQHALRIAVDDELFVDADRARLTQVLSNLLANAAKYTPNGGHIEVTAAREGESVRIDVRDDGIGIEPAMLERVFEPFAQGRQPIDRAQGGLGLGLAIAENLVKLHGGRIAVASAGAGAGSTFSVSLPLCKAPPRPSRVPSQSAPTALRRSHILVVDDNIDAAEMLAAYLQANGYRTTVAHDGPEALARASEDAPAIAILDLGLPVMDGYELARHFLSKPGAPVLVALTGYGQAEDRKKTAEVGFRVHLVKPVDLPTLRAAVRELLDGEPA
ncbi:MAG: hybrid sensor histidine kinase/response regulator, partial [Myxococcales bacterium]|nr:hybrid sensor histidine kinase/response regulator [Myxococcales bacterium]